jgi:hypothetical protein
MMPAATTDDTSAATARTRGPGLGLVRSWVVAFNRRDVEALVRLALPTVVVYPTALFRRQDRYGGHDGLRRWIADIADDLPASVRVSAIRQQRSGEFLVIGAIVVRGKPVSPVAGLVVVRDGLVASARSYLSDEQTMRDVGHIDR